MLRRNKDKKTRTPKSVPPSIISSDMNIMGSLITDGSVDVGGRIQGDIKAHHVTVRAGGKVHGDITADIAQIYGHVKGVVRAREVHLYDDCHVDGTILHEVLSIEDGAFVDGKFKRTDKIMPQDMLLENAENNVVEHNETAENISVMENLRLISGSKE